MPRMLAASRGARSLCMEMRIDDFKREDNTISGGYGIRRHDCPVARKTLRPGRPALQDRMPCAGKLVAQRFSGFQGVSDAFLGFLFAAEGDEGFALEVEDVLFA